MRKRTTTVLAVALGLTLAGCGNSTPGNQAAAAGGDLSVVATTPEVADFARVIGGDRVTVTQLIKPGVDPHDYEPTPADIAAISTAKVVVKNGVGLEEWLDPAIESAGFGGAVADSSTGVTLREGAEHEHGEEEHAEGEAEEHHEDPHIWHDPRNAKIMVKNIEAAFAKADPEGASAYSTNLTAYEKQLDELDADTAAKIGAIPVEKRKLVTNHDAFGYYVERYQLQFVGSVIPSLDTSAELSAKQIEDLVAKIKATGTTAIFTESSLPPKAAETIAKEAGVKVVGGEDALYGDSLGAPGTPQGTYLGAERHNTETIVAALGG